MSDNLPELRLENLKIAFPPKPVCVFREVLASRSSPTPALRASRSRN